MAMPALVHLLQTPGSCDEIGEDSSVHITFQECVMKATSAGTGVKNSSVPPVVSLCIVCKGSFKFGFPYGRYGEDGGGVCSRICNETYEKTLANIAISFIQ